MHAVDLDRIEAELLRLYEETPENICGTAFGYKTTGGDTQMTPSIIFQVYEKKPREALSKEELLPATVTIDGREYVTDVVEVPRGSVRAFATCYNALNQAEFEIARLQGFPSTLVPMRGGQEIVMCPGESDAFGGVSLGTLGLFAIDNFDNRVVGVTNTHVVVDPVIYAGDVQRSPNSELIDVHNTIEPRYWALNGEKYPMSALVRDGGVAFHPAALHVKRYAPLYSVETTAVAPNYENKIDAALLIMNPKTFGATDTPFVGPDSFAVRRPSDMEAAIPEAPYLPFATKDELDALAAYIAASSQTTTPVYVYSTGRTTGPKGYCPTKRNIIYAFAASSPPI